MNPRTKRVSLWVAAVTTACVAGTGLAVSQSRPSRPAAADVPLAKDVFKNVILLRDIPVDTFFEAMGMFASAMGEDCTFCHASKAYFDKAAFAEQTPRMMRTRQMIAMVNALNKQHFGGQPRVTCFTCHGGSQSPKGEPDLALQYSPPSEDPNARTFPVDPRFSATQLFDKYIAAIGGAARLAQLKTFAARGTYSGFDTALAKVLVELFGRAPAQQTMIVHMFNGDSVRTFDGHNAWMAGPDTPLPLVKLTDGNLEGARLDAMLWFPGPALRDAFSDWRIGRTAIDEQEVLVAQGLSDGQPRANFYFDDSGMLVRVVRWTQTPVGYVPTQIDYEDYREVNGIKIPFRRSATQTYMQMTVDLEEFRPNAPVDAATFATPKPVVRAAAGQ